MFGGFFSWLGLLNARLHPALALVVIVPFMPGPEAHALEAAEVKQNAGLKEKVLASVTQGSTSAGITAEQVHCSFFIRRHICLSSDCSREQAEWMKDASKAAMDKTATSGSSITAAYNKKLLGAKKDDSLKVTPNFLPAHPFDFSWNFRLIFLLVSFFFFLSTSRRQTQPIVPAPSRSLWWTRKARSTTFTPR